VDVFAVSAVELHEDHYHAYNHADEVASGLVNATFTNGVATGGFVNAEFIVHDTAGTLTLTGLGDFNDKYIVATGRDGNNTRLLAGSAMPDQHELTGAKVSGGSVTLKVWKFANNMEWGSFNGTETGLQFSIAILDGPGAELHNDHYHFFTNNPRVEAGYVVTNFTNGAGNGAMILVRATTGSLTITGLDDFNGKYVVALGEDGDENDLLAGSALPGKTVTGGTVSNGSVTLKVWKYVSATEWGVFDGTETVEFHVDVVAAAAVELHGNHYHADSLESGHVDANFSNGTGNGAFEEGDDEHEGHDH
jgi:hypothetical protein